MCSLLKFTMRYHSPVHLMDVHCVCISRLPSDAVHFTRWERSFEKFIGAMMSFILTFSRTTFKVLMCTRCHVHTTWQILHAVNHCADSGSAVKFFPFLFWQTIFFFFYFAKCTSDIWVKSANTEINLAVPVMSQRRIATTTKWRNFKVLYKTMVTEAGSYILMGKKNR